MHIVPSSLQLSKLVSLKKARPVMVPVRKGTQYTSKPHHVPNYQYLHNHSSQNKATGVPNVCTVEIIMQEFDQANITVLFPFF